MRRIMLAAALLALTIPVLIGLTPGTARAQLTTEAMLDSIQHASFLYFWNEANPLNGLIKDRSTSASPASIAAVGFGLSSICTGVDRGWVTRGQGAARVLTTLQTFWDPEAQGSGTYGYIGYKGLFYHFLDMNVAVRTWDCELSTIDTALLMAGILDAKMYFAGSDTNEVAIRALADSIYRRADWNYMRNSSSGIYMGWKPGTGFTGFSQWKGYNEAMILYILALGSPTHPVPSSTWFYWMSGYQWSSYYGYSYYVFAPLFGHQYSHCWVDFRAVQDTIMKVRGITYFENSRRATLAQRAYARANPSHWTGYSDSLWGLTASDIPNGYNARGAPPAQSDDGTITPTAPLGSLPFAADSVIPTIRNLFNNYPSLWGPYGFRDAFNLSTNPVWYDTDYIGIDQGPIVMMIENYRTGAIWNRFMQNADVQRGMTAATFRPSATIDVPPVAAPGTLLASNAPNPFSTATTIRFTLPQAGPARVAVYDVSGREVARLVDGDRPAGPQSVEWSAGAAPSGIYYVRLTAAGRSITKRCVRLR
jgi:hypothetical protein